MHTTGAFPSTPQPPRDALSASTPVLPELPIQYSLSTYSTFSEITEKKLIFGHNGQPGIRKQSKKKKDEKKSTKEKKRAENKSGPVR